MGVSRGLMVPIRQTLGPFMELFTHVPSVSSLVEMLGSPKWLGVRSINIGAWLPTGCPQRMGAELWAEGIGARVKPGARGMVPEGNEERVQGPLASLFTHSLKLIPLELPPANLLSLCRECPDPGPVKEKQTDRSAVVTTPPSLGGTRGGRGCCPP